MGRTIFVTQDRFICANCGFEHIAFYVEAKNLYDQPRYQARVDDVAKWLIEHNRVEPARARELALMSVMFNIVNTPVRHDTPSDLDVLPVPELEKPGFVYFVTVPTREAIKIGFTTQPARRFRTFNLVMGQPIEVLCCTPGTMLDEKELHATWKHLRGQGEWFNATAELLDFITARAAATGFKPYLVG
jgi:hypothetical protein